jgi:hypothetical protein
MWPLALLRTVGLSPFSLLVVQDLAIAGMGLVVFRMGLEHLDRHAVVAPRAGPAFGLGLLVALLITPWVYWTASFDFHFQPLAAFFVAMCARDVWNGRRRAWWWVAATLLCGDVAASYVMGLGLAAVLSGRPTRRTGWALLGTGAAWILFVVAIGSGKGSSLTINYGYLVHSSGATGIGATFALLWGILRHPSAALSVLHHRWSDIYKFVAAAGTIGVVSALGFGLALVTLVPNALNQSGVFIGPAGAFQNLVAVIFMTLGGVTVLTWILRRRRGALIAAVVGSLALLQIVVVSVHWVSKIHSTFDTVTSGTAADLARVQSKIPAGAEVIVSQGVIGRFGARAAVYPFLDVFADGQTVPVTQPVVAFVFVPHDGIETATGAQTQAAIALVKRRLKATVIAAGPNVTAFLWHPPKGRASVTFGP